MIISDVKVRKINPDSKMKAIVSVTFNDEFVVHDIKIIEGTKGLFIAMPSRKIGESEFRDIAHPISSESRGILQDAIFEAYEKAGSAERDDDSIEFNEFDLSSSSVKIDV